jgi:two-component system, NtrC family, nitrogen regulation sensor histidine kinase NtrY
VEAAVPLGRNPRKAIAVVVVQDPSARAAVDGLVLFAVAAALAAFGLGGRAALTLSRPIEEVTRASRRIGSGEAAGPIERPHASDLAELVEAFEGMAAQVRERTTLLARERAVAIELLSNLTAAVVLFRAKDGEVVLANPKAEELLPGGSLPERLAGEAWKPMRDLIERAGGSRAPVETRIAIRQPEGERVFRVVVAPLPPDGSEQRSALLLEDLTGFVRAERLTAWVEAAKAIAHDIKNPLTPIRLSAERLLRPTRSEEPGRIEEAASTILRQVGILTDRIGRLGRFSEPVPAPRTLEGEGLLGLLREIQADFSASPAIRVEVEAPPLLPSVAADPEALRDALSNLVVNSVEAIGTRGGTVRLTASVGKGGGDVTVTCSDDGPGVGPDDLDRIFEPSFSTKSRGSGMGLAAARRTIESVGGSVAAAVNPAGGLSIAFRLLVR